MDSLMKVLVVFVLVFSGSAHADEKSETGWVQAASTQDYVVYLNTQIERQDGPYVKYWVRKEFVAPQPSSDGPDYVKEVSLHAADCKAGSVAYASKLRYTKAGSVIYRASWEPKEFKFEAPLPGSTEASLFKRVCESRY